MNKEKAIDLWHGFQNIWLEILLFCVAIGNADVLHHYLVSTGSKDTIQLTVAIYATELVIVFAGMWGIVGLGIAAFMFAASLVSIHSLYGDGTLWGGNWIGHSYFSITIFLGTVGNLWRREIHKAKNNIALSSIQQAPEALKLETNDKGQIDSIRLSQLSVAKLRAQFNLSHNGARKIQRMAREGQPVTVNLLQAMRKSDG